MNARPYIHITKTLNLIKASFPFLRIILAFAIQVYCQNSMHARIKRGIVDQVDYGAKELIKTALDSDIQDLRQRYSHLISTAETNKWIVNLYHNIMNSLRGNVQNLLESQIHYELY